MHGEELPDGLSLPDQMAYTCLRHIYAMYYSKTISRDRAAAEKQRVRRAWQSMSGQIAYESKLALQRAQILRDTETAKTACRKDPSPENALCLCNALDGIGDTT